MVIVAVVIHNLMCSYVILKKLSALYCMCTLDLLLSSLFLTLDHHPVVRKAQLRPEKLSVEFQAVNDSLRGVFGWQVSQAAPGQAPITGFQFSWVRVSNGGGGSSSGDATDGAATDAAVSHTETLPPVSLSVRTEGK